MINSEITLLGMALALDAAIVAFALGICIRDKNLHHKLLMFLYISLLFGVFQALTLWLGSFVGEYVTFSYFGPMFHYLVSGIFLFIGLKLLTDTFKDEVKHVEWGIVPSLVLALATSLDSFAAGISLATLPKPYLSALWVGIITFGMSYLFSLMSHFFERIPEKWLLRFGALIFFILGSQIFVEKFF